VKGFRKAMRPRDRAWRLSAAAVLLAATGLPAAAADKPCTGADKAFDATTSWAALHRAVADYGHCDKGPTAEIVTEAVLRVVIGGWPKVGEAGPFLDKDAAFKKWLERKLSSTDMPNQDSAEIRDLAKNSCPKGQAKVCGDILYAVESGRALSAPEMLQLTPVEPAPAIKP
jgi:hypothetical protein